MYRDNSYKEDIRSVAQKMSDVRKEAKEKVKINGELHTQKQYPKILVEIEKMSRDTCGAASINNLLECLTEEQRVYVCWETLVVLLRKDEFIVHALRNSSGNLTTNSSVSWGEEIVQRHRSHIEKVKVELKLTRWGKFKMWILKQWRGNYE